LVIYERRLRSWLHLAVVVPSRAWTRFVMRELLRAFANVAVGCCDCESQDYLVAHLWDICERFTNTIYDSEELPRLSDYARLPTFPNSTTTLRTLVAGSDCQTAQCLVSSALPIAPPLPVPPTRRKATFPRTSSSPLRLKTASLISHSPPLRNISRLHHGTRKCASMRLMVKETAKERP